MESDGLKLPKKIPTSIITGFLGSGKTTILNDIINYKEFKNTLLIINEFGKISIDHHLIKKKSDDKIVLNNGCLCCSFSGDLVKTLDDTLKLRKKFDRIIIETSGLADPIPIVQTIVSDQIISEKIKFKSLITVVDTVNFQNDLHNHLENFKQITSADIILLSKTDISENNKKKEVIKELKRLNLHAEILDKNLLKLHEIKKIFTNFNIKKLTIQKIDNTLKTKSNFLHKKNFVNETKKVKSISINIKHNITKDGLKLWLNALARFKSNNLLRMKGIIKVEKQVLLINAVQKVFHEPIKLDKWPFDDHHSKIVFITKNLDDEDLKKTINVLNFKKESKNKIKKLSFSQKDYSNFVNAMSKFDALTTLDR